MKRCNIQKETLFSFVFPSTAVISDHLDLVLKNYGTNAQHSFINSHIWHVFYKLKITVCSRHHIHAHIICIVDGKRQTERERRRRGVELDPEALFYIELDMILLIRLLYDKSNRFVQWQTEWMKNKDYRSCDSKHTVSIAFLFQYYFR